MAKFDNPLNEIRIASPCPANWNEMVGDERRRYCGECKLNVYNLSGMTRHEAENLILDSEGRLCVRFYRRSDGTILTKDCPVGWQAIKRRVSKTAAAFVSLVFAVLSGLGLNAFYNQSKTNGVVMGEMAIEDDFHITGKIASNSSVNANVDVKGEMKITPFMGNIAVNFDETQFPKSNRQNRRR